MNPISSRRWNDIIWGIMIIGTLTAMLTDIFGSGRTQAIGKFAWGLSVLVRGVTFLTDWHGVASANAAAGGMSRQGLRGAALLFIIVGVGIIAFSVVNLVVSW